MLLLSLIITALSYYAYDFHDYLNKTVDVC